MFIRVSAVKFLKYGTEAQKMIESQTYVNFDRVDNFQKSEKPPGFTSIEFGDGVMLVKESTDQIADCLLRTGHKVDRP